MAAWGAPRRGWGSGRVCGLSQAKRLRVGCIAPSLVPDRPVHGDTATDFITVALRNDVATDRRQRGRYRDRPRQRLVDFVDVGVGVEVVDLGGGAGRAEHVIHPDLRVKLHDLYI